MRYRSLKITLFLASCVLMSVLLLGVLSRQTVATQDAEEAVCQDGYALWAGKENGRKTLDWSGSNSTAQGRVHSNNDIELKGSNNTINGPLQYVTLFLDDGDNNSYEGPHQVSASSMPVSYDVNHYRPGGSFATAALAENRYHSIVGDFEVNQQGALLDGLYYVLGKVEISASDVSGTFTIVAEGDIAISGSDHDFAPYADGLLFFSNVDSGKGLKLEGSNGLLRGIHYVPDGDIELSGSANVFEGTLFAHKVKLGGSSLNLRFEESYCPSPTGPTATPFPLPTSTSTLVPSASPTPTPGLTGTPGPTQTPSITPSPQPIPNFIALHLPLLPSNFVPPGPGEPNNTCDEAHGVQLNTTYGFLAEDLDDWYHFRMVTPGNVSVHVSNFVPEAGQVAVYWGETCGSAIFLQNNGETARDKTVALGEQLPGNYYVYVSNDGVLNNTDLYNLHVEVSP